MPAFARQSWAPLFWRLLGIACFLAAWQTAASIVKSELILPGPSVVLAALVNLSRTAKFWFAVSGSLARVLESFIISIAMGLLSGFVAGISLPAKAFLSPFITGVRATPVLALILLAMFWFPSSQVPVFSAVLMAFPVMHTSAEAGIRAVDQNLLQMSRLFHVPKRVMLWRLRIPSALPYILSGGKNALGLCWKVVVAGEVLSQPRMALGSAMQESRLMLETANVFAWALMTILLCGLSEYLFGLISAQTNLIYLSDDSRLAGADQRMKSEHLI